MPSRCLPHAAARLCVHRRSACSGQLLRWGCQQSNLQSRGVRCAVVDSSERASATAAEGGREEEEEEELQIEGIDKKWVSLLHYVHWHQLHTV